VTRAELLQFLRAQRYAVQASVADDNAPQAAVIGVAVCDTLELVFDTVHGSRKCQNLRKNPHIALVFTEAARTLQCEGVADEPTGAELQRLKAIYLQVFPDGVEREGWPDITYFRVRLTWARFSDFGAVPPGIVDIVLNELPPPGLV
jgi:hypothetical protein